MVSWMYLEAKAIILIVAKFFANSVFTFALFVFTEKICTVFSTFFFKFFTDYCESVVSEIAANNCVGLCLQPKTVQD